MRAGEPTAQQITRMLAAARPHAEWLAHPNSPAIRFHFLAIYAVDSAENGDAEKALSHLRELGREASNVAEAARQIEAIAAIAADAPPRPRIAGKVINLGERLRERSYCRKRRPRARGKTEIAIGEDT